MLKTFDGYCPKCGGGCEDSRFEYHGDFVTADLVCDDCGYEFSVLYDNGKFMGDK